MDIKMCAPIPKEKMYLATSGGADSMAILHFLMQSSNRKNIHVAHVDHGTEFGAKARVFVEEFCKENNIPLHIYELKDKCPPKTSQEEFWRNARYDFFHSLAPHPVITAHHLNDSIETWIFTSLHGNPKIIPYNHKNVIRPFLLTTREGILSYCKRKGVPYLDDPSNEDVSYMRNKIRHDLMPHALEVNPGLEKVIKKKVMFQCEQIENIKTVYKDGFDSNSNKIDNKNNLAKIKRKF